MALPLGFGVLAPQVVPYIVQVDRWRELEEYGFDNLWFADHFVNPARPSGRWFEAYTLMAAAAAQTSRIRLGTLVSSITLCCTLSLASGFWWALCLRLGLMRKRA